MFAGPTVEIFGNANEIFIIFNFEMLLSRIIEVSNNDNGIFIVVNRLGKSSINFF